MRMVGLMLGVLALAAPARSQDIYRWTDGDGNVHFTNTPTSGSGPQRVDVPPPESAEPAPARTGEVDGDGGEAADVASTLPADAEAASAGASLRRNALERDLRATEKRLRELDTRLASFARARGQRAKGSSATGGVRANIEILSEEEKALTTEREQLAQHATEVRGEAARLRAEVTARAGGTTPAWWVELR